MPFSKSLVRPYVNKGPYSYRYRRYMARRGGYQRYPYSRYKSRYTLGKVVGGLKRQVHELNANQEWKKYRLGNVVQVSASGGNEYFNGYEIVIAKSSSGGDSVSEMIGSKIHVKSLEMFVHLDARLQISNSTQGVTTACHVGVRVVVFQLIGCNGSNDPAGGNYHKLWPPTRPQQWLANFPVATGSGISAVENMIAIAPFVTGISRSAHILSDKVFWLDTGNRVGVDKKYYTKKPDDVVWEQSAPNNDEGDDTEQWASNGIGVFYAFHYGGAVQCVIDVSIGSCLSYWDN